MTWVQTYSGVAFELLAPRAEDVRAADLAHALAYSCRFGGHTRSHLSVAQHSILVAALVWHRTGDADARLHALLHDAHEAYTGDIKQPVKWLVEERAGRGVIAAIEAPIDAAIFAWARLEKFSPGAVKRADSEILLWERDRFVGPPVMPWFLDGKVDELTDDDFGVGPGSSLLEAWRPEIAERAFAVALRWCCKSVEGGAEAVPPWLFHELHAGLCGRARRTAASGEGEQ